MPDHHELKGISVGQGPRHELSEMHEEVHQDVSNEVKTGFTLNDQRDMQRMGKKQEMRVSLVYNLCNTGMIAN
ncbi:hypothetical protein EYZ11_006777 [Aspergillus tanneri]|uniref:Uncharacterized protein n=1 Tax=Aspergillus tanneri TaxID=1220188 RepID=A0A4S3JGV5_9EURO|nr:hypothetical protein EYZ11_006777 [Aspergillus tanneri]